MENKRKISKNRVLNVTNMIKRYNKHEFCLSIPFQRAEDQWDKERKSMLIDSMLNGYKIPSLWICVTPTEMYPANSVIDGIQRMTTIIQFVNDGFKLSKKIKPITLTPEDYVGVKEVVTYDIGGKKFSKLPEVLQDMILYADLDLQELYNFTDDEIEEQFYRLNNGVAMTASQKLKVILGTTVAGKIKPLTQLPFWSRTKFTAAQIKHDEAYATILQCLMLTTGYGDNEDNKVKTFSASEIAKFAAYYSENCNDKDLEYLKTLIMTLDDNLMTSDENNKFLNKTNIPPLIANVDKFLSHKEDGEFTDEDYTRFLNDWVDHNAKCSGYIKLNKDHTTGSNKVNARVEMLDQWLNTYVRNKKTGGKADTLPNVDKNTREYIEGLFAEPNTEQDEAESAILSENSQPVKQGKPLGVDIGAAPTDIFDDESEVIDIEAESGGKSEECEAEAEHQEERIGA